MKISSASKKVLASALSAAMVVAFAPTVAFGAQQYEKVTLSYDFAGGQVVSGQGIASTVEKDVDANQQVTVDVVSNYKKGGYDFKQFFVDANENGVKDANEKTVVASGAKLDVKDVTAGSTVKLVAQYDAPEFAAATSQAGTDASTAQLAVGISAATAISGHNYKVAITKGGAEVATASYTDTELKSAGSLTLKFAAKEAHSMPVPEPRSRARSAQACTPSPSPTPPRASSCPRPRSRSSPSTPAATAP